jgi:hypothetical protein
MNKMKYLILFLAIVFSLWLCSSTLFAAAPLDEIQNYEITVDVRQDGTLDMHYSIRWKVLNSTSEGPLEWVKIGIPNKHVNEITAITDNIKKIGYYGESGDTFIRIDFKRAYQAGETVTFEYRFHQSFMYTIDEDRKLVTYNFTPGWFEEIAVKNLTIRWNTAESKGASTSNIDSGYYTWNTALAMGQKYAISVRYNADAYAFNPDQQYRKETVPIIGLLFIGFLFFGIFGLVIYAIIKGSYHRGFGRPGYVSPIHHTGCVHSSCACACACACAGGGRAGCSLKDFYGTNLQTKDLKQVIDKHVSK